MKFKKTNQCGFAPIAIIAIIVVSCTLLATGYAVYTENHDKKTSQSTSVPQSNNQVSSSDPDSTNLKNEKTTTPITDPDKKKIIALLVKDCGADGEQKLSSLANDSQKFVVKEYYARVNVACTEGSYMAYLEKDDAGNWKIIEKTQQAPNCKNFDNSVGLSREIVSSCYDESSMKEREVQ